MVSPRVVAAGCMEMCVALTYILGVSDTIFPDISTPKGQPWLRNCGCFTGQSTWPDNWQWPEGFWKCSAGADCWPDCWPGHPVQRWLSKAWAIVPIIESFIRDVLVKALKAAALQEVQLCVMMVAILSVRCMDSLCCSLSWSQGAPQIADRSKGGVTIFGIYQGTEDREMHTLIQVGYAKGPRFGFGIGVSFLF